MPVHPGYNGAHTPDTHTETHIQACKHVYMLYTCLCPPTPQHVHRQTVHQNRKTPTSSLKGQKCPKAFMKNNLRGKNIHDLY